MDQILVLPPYSKEVSPELRKLIHRSLVQELRNYLPANVLSLEIDEGSQCYTGTENIRVIGDVLDPDEVGRLGSLVNASHVIAVYVHEFRPYPPQKISLRLVVVDVELLQDIVHLDGVFDASEQQVVLALSDHLQARRARRFDTQSLGIMLQSPAEFSGFVSARCAETGARELKSGLSLKKKVAAADKREGKVAE